MYFPTMLSNSNVKGPRSMKSGTTESNVPHRWFNAIGLQVLQTRPATKRQLSSKNDMIISKISRTSSAGDGVAERETR